jgi:hypothetical protein
MKKFPTFLFAFVVFSVLFIIFSRAKNDVIGMIQEKTQLKPKKEKVDFLKDDETAMGELLDEEVNIRAKSCSNDNARCPWGFPCKE